MGLLKSVLVFALELLVPLLIVWAMARWRKPLWIRWGVGASAYLAYVGLARFWLHTAAWSYFVVESFAGWFVVSTATLVLQLRGGSSASEADFRAFADSLAETLVRIGSLTLAWIEFALLPALVLAVAYYTRRFVVARRGARRVGDPPRHEERDRPGSG